MSYVFRAQKGASGLLELKLQTVVNHHIGAENIGAEQMSLTIEHLSSLLPEIFF